MLMTYKDLRRIRSIEINLSMMLMNYLPRLVLFVKLGLCQVNLHQKLSPKMG